MRFLVRCVSTLMPALTSSETKRTTHAAWPMNSVFDSAHLSSAFVADLETLTQGLPGLSSTMHASRSA